MGIPAESQAHIFERFYRVDAAQPGKRGQRAGVGDLPEYCGGAWRVDYIYQRSGEGDDFCHAVVVGGDGRTGWDGGVREMRGKSRKIAKLKKSSRKLKV